MTRLQSRLALHRFVCREFGYDDMDAMLERLHYAQGELISEGASDYAQALSPHPPRARVTADQFAEYDANIAAHSRQLRMTEEHGRTWKPHQYLALLFTEHYLQRYFDDPEALCADLNHAEGQPSTNCEHAGLHGRRPAHPRFPERDGLWQNASHARPYSAIPGIIWTVRESG